MSSEDEEDPLAILKKCIEERKEEAVLNNDGGCDGTGSADISGGDDGGGGVDNFENKEQQREEKDEEEETSKKRTKREATLVLLNGPYVDPMETVLFEGCYKDVIDSLLHDKDLDTTSLRDGVSLFIKRLLRKHRMENSGDDGEGEKSLELSLDLEILISLLLQPLNQAGGLKKDLFMMVFDICHHLMEREYLKANDVYLKIAIGNMAWPIGVTAYGIHSRVADAKISVDRQTGHILTDPQSKRWVKGLKRLMTYTQLKYPPTSASKRMG